MLEDDSVQVYSRNQENNTSKYPDIIARIPNVVKKTEGEEVKSCVIDAEAVAWDIEKKQILPFQTLSTRKRKVRNTFKIRIKSFLRMLIFLKLKSRSVYSPLTSSTLTEGL